MQKIILKFLYFVSLFFLVISGFGQMPVFKRYYIADIPGLEWLAQFYTTHIIHYVSAMVLIVLVFYILFDNIFSKNRSLKIKAPIYAKIAMLFVLITTGILMMIKNFTGTPFSPNFIIFINLTHLIFCVIFLAYTLHTLLTKQKGVMSNF
jgi:hypothetical protein